MGWLRDFILKLLKVQPATDRRIVIQEPLSFRANVLKNQVWYRGDPAELEQFFKAAGYFDTDRTRFWASVPYGKVRKIHSGIVSAVIDRYSDIVAADYNGINFGEGEEQHPILDRWEELEEACGFEDAIREAVSGALSSSDGAFKISMDKGSTAPSISFYEADSVNFSRSGRKVTEVRFYTDYRDGEKEYRLEESYGLGYIRYKLYADDGKEVPLNAIPDTAGLADVTYAGDFLMAVPVIFFPSTKWKGRGKALFDAKTDSLDALDEVISQWLDAVRMGRVKRYIPEDMIPRNPDDGSLLQPNEFDNSFIAIGKSTSEKDPGKIEISQPDINYEAYVSSYAAYMDLVLQGIMSPATLGIDLKKTDNAEAQREKEKITMHVRGKIVSTLNSVLPLLAETILKADDLGQGKAPGEYEAAVKFGEYAAPDFGSTVETVTAARAGGVMSIEQAVEELYGDTWTKEEKAAEVARLKEEQGITQLEEPGVNREAGDFRINENVDDTDNPDEDDTEQ